MRKILLAGYYGFGNLGDEAILEMVLKQLLHVTERENITVLSGNKEETSKKYKIRTIDRYNVISIIGRVASSDALVFGGGSLLQDVTSKRSIYYYLLLIRIAKTLGKKVIMLSQGIGPILSQRSKSITARVLNTVDHITVRDVQSMEFLISIGVNRDIILLSADPVINFRQNDTDERTDDGVKRVCFSLRNWKDVNVYAKIAGVTKRLCEKGIKCFFVPFYYNEDLRLVEEIESILGDQAVYYKERLSTEQAYDIIREMNLLVGVRLHALIFASAADVPFVAVSYDHKVDHFVESVNMSVACSIEVMDEECLYEEIMKKLDNEQEERRKLKSSVGKLRELINVNYDILKNI